MAVTYPNFNRFLLKVILIGNTEQFFRLLMDIFEYHFFSFILFCFVFFVTIFWIDDLKKLVIISAVK